MNYYDYLYRQAPTCPAGSSTYTIVAGDTLYSIARRFNTTVAAITAANPGINPSALMIGQQICVPGTPTPPPGCPGGFIYTIQSGDTFYGIAAQYNITLQQLINANPGVDPARLVVGQTICVPTSKPLVPVSTPCCLVLQAIFPALPPNVEIPAAGVFVRQLAMNTLSYTAVATMLPDPRTLGSFDGYACVLTLYRDPSEQPLTTIIRLLPSNIGNQTTTWAGTILTSPHPITEDVAEIRPYNSSTGAQGSALLRSTFATCRG